MKSVEPPSTLRRRNSISTPLSVPTKLNLTAPRPLHSSVSIPNGSASSSPPFDLELISLNGSFASYTSLKDILPSSPANSPTATGSASSTCHEISIRNRLVKQAAWAYLQPMASSPESSGLRCFWLRFCPQNPISACVRFFNHHLLPLITRVLDRILRYIGAHVTG